MTAKSYDLNNISLHVWEAGPVGGKPLFLLHGFPEAGFGWEKVMTLLAQEGFRVFAPDQRGYNRSSKPRGVGAYQVQHLAADIVALITAKGYQKAVIAGHDWGGGVAWHLARYHPEVVEKLVILNMPHPEVMRHQLLHNGRQQMKSSYAAFFQLPLLPEWLAKANHCRVLERSLTRTSVPGTFTAGMIARYKTAWQKPYALTAMINWYRAYSFTRSKKAASINMPVLIIWGKKDAFLLAEMAEQSAAQCTNVQLELLEDATHWLHHEKPEKVAELIADFVDRSH